MPARSPVELSKSIVKTLLYYDIFNYPLKSAEVLQFLDTNHVDENDIRNELAALRDQGLVFQFGELFTIQNNEANIARRINGNMAAKKYLKLAKEKGKLIMRFPFVRAVMASGSLSKEYMDEHSDLDFFIITKPGRLWIARTLLVLYKRIFLSNSHKYFCVNYFIDSDHLEIEEKNIFTATELATVIPLHGVDMYHKLQAANPWLLYFFPNYQPRSTEESPVNSITKTRIFLEKSIDLLFQGWMNKLFMKLTLLRWRKLYQGNYSAADFAVAFKTKDYASKNHPNHYQQKVLALYQDKVEEFNAKISMMNCQELTLNNSGSKLTF